VIVKALHGTSKNCFEFSRDDSQSVAIFLELLHGKTFMRHFRKCIYDSLETIL
jgi:hypothetical protein